MTCPGNPAFPTALVALIALLLSSAPERAKADGGAEDKAAAEALFADARQLMHDGKIAEACRKFAGSYSLARASGTLLNLALCHEKEGKIASAWAEYKQSVVEARRAGRTDRETIAGGNASALEPQLPQLIVVVPPEARASGIVVSRNESVLDAGGWGTELPVDPGEVTIEAHAPRRLPWSTKIVIQPAEHQSVTVPVLAIDEQALAIARPPYWTARKTLATAVAVTGLAGIGVGAYFGYAALASKKDGQNLCPTMDGELRCTTAGAADSQRAVEQAWVSDIAIGVGVAALAAGVVLFVTDKRREQSAPTAPVAEPDHTARARVDVLPLGLAGAAVRVRW